MQTRLRLSINVLREVLDFMVAEQMAEVAWRGESEIDVQADLTGEVDLQFKSDYFPLERFATTGVIAQIQQNTPNPGANKPVTGARVTESSADS